MESHGLAIPVGHGKVRHDTLKVPLWTPAMPIDDTLAVHVTCSMLRMNAAHFIIDLAKLCAKQVVVPEGIGCCGFAGDRGFTHPEVNAYALRKLAPQLKEKGVSMGYSNSRTCEIGLTTNSGIPYQSIVYLVDQCATAKKG